MGVDRSQVASEQMSHSLFVQRLKPLLLFLLYGYAAWMALYPFLTYWRLDTWNEGGFQAMIDGTAYKPFIYRRLIADGLQALGATAPFPVLSALNSLCSPTAPWPAPEPFIPFGPVRGYVALYAAWVGLCWGCFTGHAYAMRQLTAHFYPGKHFWINIVPVVSLGLMPLCFRYFSYIYDPATVFLSTVCLLLIIKRHWVFYCAAFLAACLNKETSVLIIIEYLILMWGVIPRSRIFAGAGAQFVIWAAVTLFIRMRYSSSPVDPITPNQFHLVDHNIIYLLQNPLSILYVTVVVASFWILIARRWRESPLVLRRCLVATLAPLVGSCLFFGYIDELRAYYDAWPVVVLLALPGLAELMECVPQEVSR